MLAALVAASFFPAATSWAQTPEPYRTAKSEKKPTKPPPAPKPADIDKNGVLILIRSTLLALDQANKTGNYTVLRDLGAPGFQTNTAARLGEIFASQRAQNLDLSGVAVLEPQLSMLPQIESSGMMHMAGFFPSVPTQIRFEVLYAPVQGQWKLFGLSVSLGSSSPTAPSDAPAAPPPSAPEKPKPKGATGIRSSTPKP
ncbi:MAG: hypothetical protein AB7F41_02330 [Methylocystis sp.]|uniref:hypothetical protein n=1 Tax=Methylocystis sp. TaxID=1911079 RepID=UPI003D127E57